MNNDLISRRDIKDHISELLLVYSGEELANAILNAINNAEVVESERPQGEWKHHEEAREAWIHHEEVREAWKKLYSEIDKDNWLFVGTINPEMVALAIKALEFIEENYPKTFIDYLNGELI